MAEVSDRQLNILVVSSSAKFNDFMNRVLMGKRYAVPDFSESGSGARRQLNEREYDLIVVNTPLKDEYGVDFCMDISGAHNVGIILITSEDTYSGIHERCVDMGVMVLTRPVTNRLIDQSIRLICSIRGKFRQTEEKVRSLEDKMEEIRVTNRSVNRAKWLLIEKEGLSEEEAHRRIEKTAMDRSLSKREIADDIIKRYG